MTFTSIALVQPLFVNGDNTPALIDDNTMKMKSDVIPGRVVVKIGKGKTLDFSIDELQTALTACDTRRYYG